MQPLVTHHETDTTFSEPRVAAAGVSHFAVALNAVRDRGCARAILIQAGVFLADLLIIFAMNVGGCEPREVTHGVTVLMMLTFVWGFAAWRLIGRNWFDPFFLLFLATYMYNCGQFVIDFFGFETGKIGPLHTVFRFSESTIRDGAILILNSINLLLLGAFVAAGRPRREVSGPPRDERVTRGMGWFLLAVSVVPTMLSLKEQLSIRMSDGYGAIWLREQSTGLGNFMSVLADLMVPGVLFLLAGSRGRTWSVLVSFAGLAVQSGMLIIVGDRSGAIMPWIGFAWVFHYCVRPIPQALLVSVGVFLVAFVVPIIPQIRQMSASDYADPSVILNAYFSIDNPLVQTFDESGSSAFVVCDVLELVPRRSPYTLGLGYLNTALVNLNFLIPIDLTGRGELSKWLIYVRYPWRAQAALWLGFSYIAEAYMEFGWVGGPIVLGLFGLLLVRLTDWATTGGDAARIGMVGTFALLLPHFARGCTLELARPFFRYALLPYLMIRAYEWYSRQRRVHSHQELSS